MPQTEPHKNANKTRWLPEKFQPGFIESLDRRTDLYLRVMYSFERMVEDCGGLSNLAHTKRALIERFAFLEEFLRKIEVVIAQDPVKHSELLGKWTQAVNSMTGISKLLGLKVVEKGDYLDSLYATPPAGTPQSNSEGFKAKT